MPIPKGDHARAVEIGSKGGRPKGSLDRRWNNLQNWYEMLMEGWEKLTPKEKFDGSLAGMRMILEKVQSVHLTSEESKTNVQEQIEKKRQEALNGLSTPDA